MKKLCSALLLALLILTLAACGGSNNVPADLPTDNTGSVDVIDDVTTPEGSDTTTNTSEEDTDLPDEDGTSAGETLLDENGYYYSKEEVCEYLVTYEHLPDNFITKKEAQDLGWSGGSVEKYAPGCAIGGDRFGNREGILPKASGRTYTECDIDTNGASSRGAKRIVFSNDGLIYYTEDHYETFTLLYGEE